MRLAKENKSWGYDRIAGALANLGHEVADQTVGNIVKRHGIPLAPERRKTTTWREFIRSHMDVLAATDFFTTEVWTQGGLVTYDVLFFIHLATRRVHVAGITSHPNEQWLTQVARNVTMADVGFVSSSRYLIHDRDSKFCESFHRTIEAVGVAPIKLPRTEPGFELVRGALGEVSQRGMSLEAHPVRREVAPSCALGSTSSTIITRGIIKARRIYCCSQPATSYLSPSARCAPVNGLAGCYVSTIGKPHEYFDLTA